MPSSLNYEKHSDRDPEHLTKAWSLKVHLNNLLKIIEGR